MIAGVNAVSSLTVPQAARPRALAEHTLALAGSVPGLSHLTQSTSVSLLSEEQEKDKNEEKQNENDVIESAEAMSPSSASLSDSDDKDNDEKREKEINTDTVISEDSCDVLQSTQDPSSAQQTERDTEKTKPPTASAKAAASSTQTLRETTTKPGPSGLSLGLGAPKNVELVKSLAEIRSLILVEGKLLSRLQIFQENDRACELSGYAFLINAALFVTSESETCDNTTTDVTGVTDLEVKMEGDGRASSLRATLNSAPCEVAWKALQPGLIKECQLHMAPVIATRKQTAHTSDSDEVILLEDYSESE